MFERANFPFPISRGQMAPLTCLVAFLLVMVGPSMADEVPIVQTWRGKSKDNALKSAAPANGMITDAAAWQKIWLQWRDAAEVPPIDFASHLVIVAMAHGPNNVTVKLIERGPDGAVTYRAASTRMGGPGFGYLMLQVPRDGISSIRNHPVPDVVTGTDPSDINSPDSSARGEFIKVTVSGTIQTGVAAVGGETTGTTITANGITWELDLTSERGLQLHAQRLQGQRVRLTGELTRKRGVEIAERWIVKVAKMNAVD